VPGKDFTCEVVGIAVAIAVGFSAFYLDMDGS
jgi:hypothetical protein